MRGPAAGDNRSERGRPARPGRTLGRHALHSRKATRRHDDRAGGTPALRTRDAPPRRELQRQRAHTTRLLIHVVPGLEEVASEEVADRFPEAQRLAVWQGFDERTSFLEYRSADDPRRWLALDTVEDVFALVARARSLRPDMSGLAALVGAVRNSKYFAPGMSAYVGCWTESPRSYRVVARAAGLRTYRRVDAQRAVEAALAGQLGNARLVEDDAEAEFWLTIIDQEALVGIRLSTAQMRGPSSRLTTIPASLKPTVARAMTRLSVPQPTDIVLDPCCGAGTLLTERALLGDYAALLGGDIDPAAVAIARDNANAANVDFDPRHWNALDLPLADCSVDIVLTNPPFGKKVTFDGEEPHAFYRQLLRETRRVLRPGGRLVLITSHGDLVLRQMRLPSSGLVMRRRLSVLLRGERAAIVVADRA